MTDHDGGLRITRVRVYKEASLGSTQFPDAQAVQDDVKRHAIEG